MMEANDMEGERLQRLRAASEWLLRLQTAKPTEGAIDEWLRWCDAHADNFGTFQRLQRSWQDLDALKPQARALRVLSSATREELKQGVLLEQERHQLRDALPSRKASGPDPEFMGNGLRRMAWALAAGIGVMALAVVAFHVAWKPPAPAVWDVDAALINRSATLPDGSKMILGAQSRVNMNFEGPQRQLALSTGEAYFKVRHDKARPFVVQAGDISVTAIGTAFDVRRGPGEVIITVEEGVVDVSSQALGRRPATWRAEAGYQVTYSLRDRSASIASVDASAELAWRNSELAYVREPLPSVVEDLNRYSSQKLVLGDAKVSELRFTGTAFASAVQDWATGIAQIYPVEVRKTESGEIVLHWRD